MLQDRFEGNGFLLEDLLSSGLSSRKGSEKAQGSLATIKANYLLSSSFLEQVGLADEVQPPPLSSFKGRGILFACVTSGPRERYRRYDRRTRFPCYDYRGESALFSPARPRTAIIITSRWEGHTAYSAKPVAVIPIERRRLLSSSA